MAGLTPMKAIRAKCLDCCCGQANEVRLCTATQCPLYEYRSGHNPNRSGKGGIVTYNERNADKTNAVD